MLNKYNNIVTRDLIIICWKNKDLGGLCPVLTDILLRVTVTTHATLSVGKTMILKYSHYNSFRVKRISGL